MKRVLEMAMQAFGWLGMFTIVDLAMRGEQSFAVSGLFNLIFR